MKDAIKEMARQLNEQYVSEELGAQCANLIHDHFESGKYDGLSDVQIAETITADVQGITNDLHLRIRVKGHHPLSRMDRDELRKENFRFRKVEILDGNIGLIEFHNFLAVELAGETAAAAMRFVSNSDALVFDLRKNGGGSPELVAFICSYLFEERTHLNSLYMRPTNFTEQFWTVPYVPGPKYTDRPVYVLTSSYTFSAAEEFTYNLQCLKRAVIIGEKTRGGANPGGWTSVNDTFEIFVPHGKAINPITNDNWEGKGVTPDITVPADAALDEAIRIIRSQTRV